MSIEHVKNESSKARRSRIITERRVDKRRLALTDEGREALLLVVDELLGAGAPLEALRLGGEGALVVLLPELPEPGVAAVDHLARQRAVGHVALVRALALRAHPRHQALVVAVEACKEKRAQSHDRHYRPVDAAPAPPSFSRPFGLALGLAN